MNLPRRIIIVGATALAMVAAVTGPVTAAEPEGTIRHAGGPTAVPDSYIVVFKKSAVTRGQVAATARSLAGQHGRTVARTYTAALRGFEISASAKQAARIAAHPAVEYVEQNHTVRIADTQPNPPSWGLDRIDQRDLPLNDSYTYPNTASNVHAYIIDTGIRFSHNDFGGRAVSGFDAVDGGSADDCNGHGTHVAGTVGGTAYGVAKGATLVGVRVLNCSGSGTTAGVIAGVDWVTDNAEMPAVANMSLGGGANTSLDTAVRNSIAAGVTYSLAAGNSNANACNTSPARVTEAITVGSTTSSDARSSFSNYGTCLDVFAPGSSITSAWHTSNTATNTISGTSMAAPHVAGAAALVASANPGWSPQEVRDYLYDNATGGAVGNPGSGSPNRLLYVVNDGTPPADNFSMSVSPTSGSTTPGGSVTATVSTATTSGSAQSVSFSASGLPSGATASFSPSSVTSGGSASLTVSTSTSTPGGSYPVTVTGTGSSATRTATFTLTVIGPGGSCTGTNGTDVAIPDSGSWVSSSISISGCSSTPSSSSTVDVNIQHTYRGDLIVDLIAPDGSSYRLKSWAFFDGADNVIETYTVNLSSETANGTWQLRVRDIFSGDTGYINTWSLEL
ncbi:S8 family serine peptidase [Solwaraspora sp. WMMA2080]|uniref:S8 family peptidase n=1 Tax=unclassified Solwaraspora TaxID=2627926 RepID=UPI00248AD5AF|nr:MULTISPECIES: S8 family peptidase [unclassified Solwaraspora]WBB96467.1 S8 family serine peptidase [Solwaraspora sp. WMMA2059]WBC19627.1 S8 family serine peptidase [Solwaraspora sp. WMMA2080]